MEQHPVPQPITNYEFRLVGDMTLKQFAKLASGVILALIVYGIDPPSLIKWFLIFLFVGIGLGMAFFPFEGRPIDVWIIAFFKRIYSPTQYVWRQDNKSKLPTLSNQPFSPPVPVSNTITTQPIQSANLAADKQSPGQNPSFQQSQFEGKKGIVRDLSKPKVEAKFTPNVVIPATPSIPNLIVGYVRNKEGKVVEGAILEIRDISGNPMRALKTNKLGQFLIATPLPNGEYEIETEKEGVSFDIIKISLRGEIISPIEIVSKQ